MSKATELALMLESRRLNEVAAAELRRLDALIEACTPYLKDGETPAERIQRERKDTEAMTRLYAKERAKTEALLAALKEVLRLYIPDRHQADTKIKEARAAIKQAEGQS